MSGREQRRDGDSRALGHTARDSQRLETYCRKWAEIRAHHRRQSETGDILQEKFGDWGHYTGEYQRLGTQYKD